MTSVKLIVYNDRIIFLEMNIPNLNIPQQSQFISQQQYIPPQMNQAYQLPCMPLVGCGISIL